MVVGKTAAELRLGGLCYVQVCGSRTADNPRSAPLGISCATGSRRIFGHVCTCAGYKPYVIQSMSGKAMRLMANLGNLGGILRQNFLESLRAFCDRDRWYAHAAAAAAATTDQFDP
jgi:hypothetical protein